MHAQTITIDVDGQWYNIPTVVEGRTVSDAAASRHAMEHGRLGRAFSSLEDAERDAQAHSRQVGERTRMFAPRRAGQPRRLPFRR